MLAQPQYFDVDRSLLANALVGPFESGHGRRPVNDFVIYDARRAGAPTREMGKWVFDLVQMVGGRDSNPALRREIIPKLFRKDIFLRALRLAEGEAARGRAGESGASGLDPEMAADGGAPGTEPFRLLLNSDALRRRAQRQAARETLLVNGN
jgi:hypothetical protein